MKDVVSRYSTKKLNNALVLVAPSLGGYNEIAICKLISIKSVVSKFSHSLI
jgi:hypothetical protein